MVQSIEVFLQPPSPTINTVDKLPPIKTIFKEDKQEHLLPTIKVNNDEEIPVIKVNDDKLKVMEPQFDSPSTSPYQSSPLMTFSSPSPSPSLMGSPMISPINDGSFLLPPPDTIFRRGRSLSNASNNTLSPLSSPSIRYLSEPPTFNLQQQQQVQSQEEEDEEEEEEDDYSPIFGPKRKRGRPPNTCQTKSQNDSHFTFVKPTVWDVKNNHLLTPPVNNNNNTLNNNKKMSDGINTFTTTNMDLALSIPKKKRGRKPKKQMIGNSCFVWKDLTAPRGANKKKK